MGEADISVSGKTDVAAGAAGQLQARRLREDGEAGEGGPHNHQERADAQQRAPGQLGRRPLHHLGRVVLLARLRGAGSKRRARQLAGGGLWGFDARGLPGAA